MPEPIPPLRTRPPTNRAPWPLVLVDGEPKTGKTYSAVQLAADPRVGQMFGFDMGEGSLDEYGSLAAGKLVVVEHDGTYRDLLGQVRAAVAAPRLHPDLPNAILLDTGTALWWSLSAWAEWRARNSRRAQDILRRDPDADIDVGRTCWNDAAGRIREVVSLLRSFDGIAIITTKGGWVSGTDAQGNPTREKVWSTSIQKDVPYDCNVHVRLTEGRKAEVYAARSLALTIPEGRTLDLGHDLDLAALIFDRMGLNPATTGARQITSMRVMVAARTAKLRLLEAYQRAGLDDDAAKAAAVEAWRAAGLPQEPGAEIDPDTLVRLVEDVGRSSVERAPDSPQEAPEPAGATTGADDRHDAPPGDPDPDDVPDAPPPPAVSVEGHREMVREWVKALDDNTLRTLLVDAEQNTSGALQVRQTRLVNVLVDRGFVPDQAGASYR